MPDFSVKNGAYIDTIDCRERFVKLDDTARDNLNCPVVNLSGRK